MKNLTNEFCSSLIKLPSTQYGLKWIPSTGDIYRDMLDGFFEWTPPFPPRHFSELDSQVMLNSLEKIDGTAKLIVEIGVDHCDDNFVQTSTGTLLNWKSQSCTYIGIDINEKTHLDNATDNIYTLQNDSAEHDKLYSLMDTLGLDKIDFMFVDGWHSISQVLLEWTYWERMAPGGIMMFHDTNFHPGPIAVLDAADGTIFDISYYGRDNEYDWGVGVVKRIVV